MCQTTPGVCSGQLGTTDNGHRLIFRLWNKYRVSGIGSLPYEERLTTLHARRERGDMVETYKIITRKVNVQSSGMRFLV